MTLPSWDGYSDSSAVLKLIGSSQPRFRSWEVPLPGPPLFRIHLGCLLSTPPPLESGTETPVPGTPVSVRHREGGEVGLEGKTGALCFASFSYPLAKGCREPARLGAIERRQRHHPVGHAGPEWQGHNATGTNAHWQPSGQRTHKIT
jgi:hypothetical protein